MIIKINSKLEARITSGSYDYGEYYKGSAHFYEPWQPGDSIPDNNPVYKRFLYRLTTDIKRTNPRDAQYDAFELVKDVCFQNGIAWQQFKQLSSNYYEVITLDN